jgi:beta-carotene 15,15'-dioxygenase
MLFMKKLAFIGSHSIEFLLLIGGIILLLMHLLVINIPVNVQMIVLVVLVFLIGVPHGALDFMVDEQNETITHQQFSIKKFVFTYMLRLVAFSLIWLFPSIAFSLFLIFSAYHFGETDLSAFVKSKDSANVLYFAYGIFILSLLFLNHLDDVAMLVPLIGDSIAEKPWFTFLQSHHIAITLCLFVFFLGTLAFYISQNKMQALNRMQIVQFGILLLVVSLLPMLLAFTFYFAIWHSLLSVRNIFRYLQDFKNPQKFSIICNKSVLFSLIALVGIGLLYFGMQYYFPKVNLLFALLVMLSILTLPHLTVMHEMYKNNIKNKLA